MSGALSPSQIAPPAAAALFDRGAAAGRRGGAIRASIVTLWGRPPPRSPRAAVSPPALVQLEGATSARDAGVAVVAVAGQRPRAWASGSRASRGSGPHEG
jgi:hypothetical protein